MQATECTDWQHRRLHDLSGGGAVQAHGEHDDPRLHDMLMSTFEGAIRIDSRGARPIALPNLED